VRSSAPCRTNVKFDVVREDFGGLLGHESTVKAVSIEKVVMSSVLTSATLKGVKKKEEALEKKPSL